MQAPTANHRSQVRAAATNGLLLPGRANPVTPPQFFVDEALLLSDLLELNELSAIELLLAGEQQQPRFPSLTRGLVAVLLHHDGRKTFLQCLRLLLQGRHGRTWTLGLSDEMTELCTNFTDELLRVWTSCFQLCHFSFLLLG